MFKKAKKNKKGFTLAELLIVVAIIAVLVAISIPIFTSQLEKSRDAVTVSNIRAAYAQAQTAWLAGADNNDTTVVVDKTNNKVVVKGVVAKGEQNGFAGGSNADLPFGTGSDVTAMGNKSNGNSDGKFDITFTYTANSDNAPVVTVAAAK